MAKAAEKLGWHRKETRRGFVAKADAFRCWHATRSDTSLAPSQTSGLGRKSNLRQRPRGSLALLRGATEGEARVGRTPLARAVARTRAL